MWVLVIHTVLEHSQFQGDRECMSPSLPFAPPFFPLFGPYSFIHLFSKCLLYTCNYSKQLESRGKQVRADPSLVCPARRTLRMMPLSVDTGCSQSLGPIYECSFDGRISILSCYFCQNSVQAKMNFRDVCLRRCQ